MIDYIMWLITFLLLAAVAVMVLFDKDEDDNS